MLRDRLRGVRARLPDAPLLTELMALPRAIGGTVPWALRAGTGRARSLLDVALANAEAAPTGLAFEMGDARLTWAGLAEETSRVAHVLRGEGVRPGDVVALLAENSPRYVALVLGISRVGATAALINTHLEGRPLAHAMRVSRARLALVSTGLASRVEAAEASPGRVLLLGEGGELDARLAEAPDRPAPVTSPAGTDFVYIYTSGTTGLPKPCRVSHLKAVMAGAAFGSVMFELGPGDKLYSVLPLYHASALLLGAGSAILTRTPMAMRASFSASQFWPDVRRYGATAVLYIGELCRYLVHAPPRPDDTDHSVRVAVGNGLRPDVWGPFQERFGIPRIREFYGATEAPGFIVNLTGKVGSVGRVPAGGAGVMVLARYDVERDEHPRDARGRYLRCGPDEPGELLVRLPRLARAADALFRGYTDERATQAKVLTDVFSRGDRWFRSGDLLRFDRDGYWYFVDRIGDTYRWKGENVSTAEVADALTRAPGVREATVVGVRVPGMEGQAGLAAVVCDGPLDPAGLWAAAQELPAYAQPRFVRVLEGLSTTGTFKVQKGALRTEGADPDHVRDPLFVRGEAAYEPLDAARWRDVLSGRQRL